MQARAAQPRRAERPRPTWTRTRRARPTPRTRLPPRHPRPERSRQRERATSSGQLKRATRSGSPPRERRARPVRPARARPAAVRTAQSAAVHGLDRYRRPPRPSPPSFPECVLELVDQDRSVHPILESTTDIHQTYRYICGKHGDPATCGNTETKKLWKSRNDKSTDSATDNMWITPTETHLWTTADDMSLRAGPAVDVSRRWRAGRKEWRGAGHVPDARGPTALFLPQPGRDRVRPQFSTCRARAVGGLQDAGAIHGAPVPAGRRRAR